MLTTTKYHTLTPVRSSRDQDSPAQHYQAVCDRLNQVALNAFCKRRLTVQDVRRVFQHFDYKCFDCGQPHTAATPVSLEHTFKLGSSRIGQHNTSNLRTVCRKCSRKDTPTWNTSNYHLAESFFSAGLQAAA